jgi:hypothetical protein
MQAFDRYIGIDYSGAKTPKSSLKGLRVYMAVHKRSRYGGAPAAEPAQILDTSEVSEWLVNRLSEEPRTLVGIDHCFSFPLKYFDKYHLPHDWLTFIDDFQRHWPTNGDIYVDSGRDCLHGNGAARNGDTRWRRITEERAGAKSVFHFDVPGSVAKSTHAGPPWLRHIRSHAPGVHFWPFDGSEIPAGRSVVAEVYPSLWSRGFARENRNDDQDDAYSAAEWMRRADRDGTLMEFFSPVLSPQEREVARIEGWILAIK